MAAMRLGKIRIYLPVGRPLEGFAPNQGCLTPPLNKTSMQATTRPPGSPLTNSPAR
jgi:hypothetical protein